MEQKEFQPKQERISPEELQSFLNSPDLDLPDERRDISIPENVGWLLRNMGIRNRNVPQKYYKALREHLYTLGKRLHNSRGQN